MLDLKALTKTQVEAALREWTRRGAAPFRDHFGITGRARKFFVVHKGENMDMKAIVAAAAIIGGQHKVKTTDVHSHGAQARLSALGFTVTPGAMR